MTKKFPKTVEMEVFRGGTQTDSQGNKSEWTEEKLNKIVASFNEVGEKVPAIVNKDGHSHSNGPAFGWFSGFKRVNDSIWATLGDINENFSEMLRTKAFKNRSIALRPNDLSPLHVAFLGAMPPAIKGLADYNFKEGEEFSQFEFDIGEKEFSEFTEDTFKEKLIQALGSLFSEKEQSGKLNKNPLIGDDNMDFKEQFEAEQAKNLKLTTELTASQAESKTFSESATSEKKRADDLQVGIDADKTKTIDKEFNAFAEQLVKDSKILPAEKSFVVTTMKTLSGQPAYDFTENGETTKRSQLEDYKKVLENKSVESLFSEKFKNGGTAADANKTRLDTEMEKLTADGKMSFSEASRELMASKPELFKGLEFTESQDK